MRSAVWCVLLALAPARMLHAQAQIVGPTQTYPLYPNTTPGASLEGTIQPVNPGWDPYADPFLQQQTPSALPQEGNIVVGPDGNFSQRERLVQQVRVEATYLPGEGGQDLGVTDVETHLTATLPFAYGVAPLLFTPGFAFHLWNGPDSTLFGVPSPDMPGATYSAYLDVGWRPQISPRFSADLGVRPGVYGDYTFFNSHTLRIKGRALGVYTPNPQFQWVFGVLYLDRQNIKILPAGGLIWTPNECTRWEVLFPRPKFAQRLNVVGNTEFWWFVAGEYGGDSWTVTRETGPATGIEDYVDYNDLRVSIGLEWTTLSNYRGLLEFGYVFERNLEYNSLLPPSISPDETWMFRGGLSF